MPHILIATDFSDNAMHAAEYAVMAFGPRDHTYTLLHTFLDITTAQPMMPTSTGRLMAASEESLREFADRFIKRTDAEGVELEVIHGTLSRAVNDLAETKRVQVVVVGNRGRTGTALFGSSTTSLIKASRIPVLAVPASAVLERPERILLADDHLDVLPGQLEMLRLLATIAQAEVLVTHVEGDDVERVPRWNDGSYEPGLRGIPHSYHEAHGLDVVDALHRLAHRRQVDMIAVLHRHLDMLSRLFHPSTAHDLAREVDLPLLVLEDAG